MKMSRSVMAHQFHGTANLQCGNRSQIAQTFFRIVPGLGLDVGAAQRAKQPGARVSPKGIRLAG